MPLVWEAYPTLELISVNKTMATLLYNSMHFQLETTTLMHVCSNNYGDIINTSYRKQSTRGKDLL